jgi:hypothetical protein
MGNSADGPKIKGEGLRQFLQWYIATFDKARLAGFLVDLPPHLAGHFDLSQTSLGLVSSAWYPAEVFHVVIDRMLADYTAEQRAGFAKRAARATIDATLKGVYKFLFETMMTPDRYAARAQKLFSRFYDTGTMTKVKLAPTTHLTEIRGWTSHHPVLCDVLLYTGDPVYSALGCKNVTTRRIACVANGDPLCSYEVSWR